MITRTAAVILRTPNRPSDRVELRITAPHADMRGSDLTGIYITASDLRNADLTWVDLIDAQVWGTNLTGAKLSNAHLRGTFWVGTTCPDGSNSDTNGLDACVALP